MKEHKMIKKIQIKQFVPDSKRPEWMIEMMCYVYRWLPMKSLSKMSTEDLLQYIENSINEVKIWDKGKLHRITEYASYEISSNKLTVFSVASGKPMVEYEIEGGE